MKCSDPDGVQGGNGSGLETAATLRAGCKINLFLHVRERLANGYHEIESLFLPLPEPHDVLDLRVVSKGGIETAFYTLSGRRPLPGIDPRANTLTRAYAWHAETTGHAPGLSIRVRKGVPHGSGLGGGSADAAALLVWLRQQAIREGRAVPDFDQFLHGAADVGADVPFFLLGAPAFASGVGERLRPAANPHAGMFLVLVCSALTISTAWAFSALDAARERKKTPPEPLTQNQTRATPSFAQPRGTGNDFEAVVFAEYPELADLHALLLQSGALEARMSGTGSSFFALYREEKIARNMAKKLARDGRSVYIQRLPEESSAG